MCLKYKLLQGGDLLNYNKQIYVHIQFKAHKITVKVCYDKPNV